MSERMLFLCKKEEVFAKPRGPMVTNAHFYAKHILQQMTFVC